MIDAKVEALKVAQGIFGNTSQTELLVVLGISGIVLIAAVSKLSSMFSAPMSGLGRAFVVSLISAAVALACLIATNVYALPLVKDPSIAMYLPWAAILAGLLLISAPCMRLIMKSRYFQSLMTLILAYCLTAVVAVVLQMGIGSVRKGAQGVDASKREEAKGVDTILSK